MAGKHVVVSGAGTGIGRAVALRLARDGASVTLLAWDEERLRETASRIAGPTHVETCDVRERHRVDRAFSRAASALGPIHGLVTCAAIGGPNGEEDEGGDRFEDIVATNLHGTYFCVRAALRHLAPGPDTRHVVVFSSNVRSTPTSACSFLSRRTSGSGNRPSALPARSPTACACSIAFDH